MDMTVLSGMAHLQLAQDVARNLGVTLGRLEFRRFLDGEVDVEIHESVRHRDVYLIQPLVRLVGEHLMELALLADACRRAGSGRLTAVLPYMGYARQDRRGHGREAVGAKVVADVLQAVHFDRVIAVDLHTEALEGFFDIPLEHLTAKSVLLQVCRDLEGAAEGVVVSPDLGGVKRAESFAQALHLPLAVVHKTRLSGEEVVVHNVVGDVEGKTPLVVDDMISTGGTIEAAVTALLAKGCVPHVTVVATHGLLVGRASERLRTLKAVQTIVITDSVPVTPDPGLALKVVSVAPLLASAIHSLNIGQTLSGVLLHA